MDVRLLKSSEIDVRVQSVKKTSTKVGCILLLYKDARVDQKILDETYGAFGWQRDHKELKGNIYCGIGVYSQSINGWVWKWDCGSESNTEKEKGEASDSFKRSAFNWGIGRELYSSPFIWVDLKDGEYYSKIDEKTKKETFYLSNFVNFSVKSISYNSDREIAALEIEDNKHQIRYTLGKVVVLKEDKKLIPEGLEKDLRKMDGIIIEGEHNLKVAKNDTSSAVCIECKKPISEAENDYSISKFKKCLCRTCQAKHKAS